MQSLLEASSAVLIESYPFYLRSTQIESLLTLASLKGPSSPDLTTPMALIHAIENHKAVTTTTDRDGRISFAVDPVLLNQAISDKATQLNVLSAVQTATIFHAATTPIATTAGAATPSTTTPTPPPNVGTIVSGILGALPSIPKIQQDLLDLAAGATVTSRHWWGVQIHLTTKAATALSDLIGTQLASLSAVMTALAAIPSLQVLGVIAGIFSALLKWISGQITQANAGTNGVNLTMLLWFIPIATAA